MINTVMQSADKNVLAVFLVWRHKLPKRKQIFGRATIAHFQTLLRQFAHFWIFFHIQIGWIIIKNRRWATKNRCISSLKQWCLLPTWGTPVWHSCAGLARIAPEVMTATYQTEDTSLPYSMKIFQLKPFRCDIREEKPTELPKQQHSQSDYQSIGLPDYQSIGLPIRLSIVRPSVRPSIVNLYLFQAHRKCDKQITTENTHTQNLRIMLKSKRKVNGR